MTNNETRQKIEDTVELSVEEGMRYRTLKTDEEATPVNTKPRSCQRPPAASRASSWRTRCDRRRLNRDRRQGNRATAVR
jgi:hypothetical protein